MLPFGSLRNRGNFPDRGPAADHLYAVDAATPSSRQKSSTDIQPIGASGAVLWTFGPMAQILPLL